MANPAALEMLDRLSADIDELLKAYGSVKEQLKASELEKAALRRDLENVLQVAKPACAKCGVACSRCPPEPTIQAGWKLYVDDARRPPNSDWVLAPGLLSAKNLILEFGPPDEADLDHDLGGDETGMQLLKWMAETGNWPKTTPKVHSANPPGRDNMLSFIESYERSKG